MTNDELKQSLLSQRPVTVRRAYEGDLEFAYVSAIIYRVDAAGRIYMQAECMDKSRHSVSLADPQSVIYKEESDTTDIDMPPRGTTPKEETTAESCGTCDGVIFENEINTKQNTKAE